MNLKKTLVLLPLIFIFFNSFFVPKIKAQEAAGFAVSPPSFEMNAIPGDSLKNTIKVENLSDIALKIQVKPQNFVAYGEGGQVALSEEGSTYSITQWLDIKDKTFTIAPKSFYLANFTINIPKNAEPGSHYGAVVFSTVPDEKSVNGTGAALSQEIGSLILLKLPGDVFEDAELVTFTPTQKYFKEPKISFNTLIANKGNIHIKPYGFISVYNLLGRKVASIEVKGRNILPGSRRLFTDEMDFKKVGFFRAETNLIYSGGGKIIKAETNFLALNQKVTKKYAAIAGVILLIYLLFRKRVNRALRVILTGK